MWKIVVVMLSLGHPADHVVIKKPYPTEEACKATIAAEVASLKVVLEQLLPPGPPVSLVPMCVEDTQPGYPA